MFLGQNNNTPTVTREGDRRGVGVWLHFKGVFAYIEIVVRNIVRKGGESDICCLAWIGCGINEVMAMEAEAVARKLQARPFVGYIGSERADGDYCRLYNPVAKKLVLRQSLGCGRSGVIGQAI